MAHSPLNEEGAVYTDQATPVPPSSPKPTRRDRRRLRTDAVRSLVLSLAPFRGGTPGKAAEPLNLASLSLDPQGSPKESPSGHLGWRRAFLTLEGSLKTPGRSGRRKKASRALIHSAEGPSTPQEGALDEQPGLSPAALWKWFERPGSEPGSPRGHASRRSPGAPRSGRHEASPNTEAADRALSQLDEMVPASWSCLRGAHGGAQSTPAAGESDRKLRGRGTVEESPQQAAPGASGGLDPGQGSATTTRLTIDTFDVRLLSLQSLRWSGFPAGGGVSRVGVPSSEGLVCRHFRPAWPCSVRL